MTLLRVLDDSEASFAYTHVFVRGTTQVTTHITVRGGSTGTAVWCGPHLGRVTGFRTVVNRTGANYGLVLHLGTLDGTFAAAVAFGAPAGDRAPARAVAERLHDRVVHPDAPGPGIPATETVPARGTAAPAQEAPS
ncbi:hypothetical protein SUDANB6_01341 [Streptomyces sp. enrichment culture]